MCGDGVGKRGGGMDVEIGGLRHHAPEQGDVEPVDGGVEMGFMSLSQLRGQYGLSRFFDGGGLRFKGLCRGEFGDGFRLIFREEIQGIFSQQRGAGLTERLCLFRCGPLGFTGFREHPGNLFCAHADFDAELLKGQPYMTLPALGADAGTGYPADHRALGGAYVVPVQAGNRKRLKDMEFNGQRRLLKTHKAI